MKITETPQRPIKRTFQFMSPKKRNQKTQRVGDILTGLGLTQVGNESSTLSINHDTILYR